MHPISRIIFLGAFFLTLAACTPRDRYIAISGYAQGGTYTVKLNLDGVSLRPEILRDGIDSILTRIDTTLSGYNKGSQLSRFNRGETIVPNDLFREIFQAARDYREETGGALDVAAAPLFDAWGFGFSKDSLPSDETVTALMEACDLDRIPEDLTRGNGQRLNYNAIAQGYSCDKVADYLRKAGVKDMLVDIGEIYCDGLNPSGKPWTLAVDKPVDGNNDPGAQIQAKWRSDGGPCGIVTSGNYRKFYIRDGKKYAHTIDPRTGRPVQHNLLSATVVAPTAMAADAYATYCMVLGMQEARAFIEGRADLEGYLIYEEDGQMKTWASEGFNLI
ncbi:MAG: FAD:protein FMN transferase [Bacteroidales bacterium]|nr:FAD:protein FMN transferase [Bacteroidales bacterium]